MVNFIYDDLATAAEQSVVNGPVWLTDLWQRQADRDNKAALIETLAGVPTTPVSEPHLVPKITPEGAIEQAVHQDYHFRVYVIPDTLTFSNPAINTNLRFRLWNTFRTTTVLQSIAVDGSSDITFTAVPLTTDLHDGELLETFLQFGGDETAIDAEVTFAWDLDPDTVFKVIATIASAFNIIPDVPVKESWEYLTDIITTYDGSEQRIALRSKPRSTINFTVQIIDLEERRDQYNILYSGTGRKAVTPLYHHGTKVTQGSQISTSRLYFDPARTQLSDGETVTLIDPVTATVVIATVATMQVDGCTITGSLGQAIEDHWFVYPSISVYLKENSGLVMQSITGQLPIAGESSGPINPVRTNANPTITTFNGLKVLDRRPLISADELFDIRKELIDNDVGIPALIRYKDPHPVISGTRKWLVDRYDGESEDWWRKFFSDVKGAQKAFYMPTWLPDLTLKSGFIPSVSSGQLIINERDYLVNYFPYNTWKSIFIEYENLDTTYHEVQSATEEPDGSISLVIDPVLQNDPEVANITRIGYLMRVRGDDRFQREHFHLQSIYTWKFKTVDD